MPEPLAICLEDADTPTPDKRYLRCAALVGRQQGLRLDETGQARWHTDQPVACELWVSGDDQLILFRPSGAGPVTVDRAGRRLEVPCDKPVVLLTQDLIEIAQRRLRVHVHGHCRSGFQPTYVVPQAKPTKKHLAAALAMGAAVAGCNRPIEVRPEPPSVPPDPTITAPPTSASATATPETTTKTIATETPTNTAAPTTSGPPTKPPIEVREEPPDVPPDG